MKPTPVWNTTVTTMPINPVSDATTSPEFPDSRTPSPRLRGSR
jgi:hypothetical protein